MAIKNQELTINFLAFDTSNNVGKTGDSANFTLRIIKDGGAAAALTNAGSISEPDSTNLPGIYEVTLTATEMNANFVTVGGVSSTSDIIIIPVYIITERGDLATVDTVVDGIKTVTDNIPDNGAMTSLQGMVFQANTAFSNFQFEMIDDNGDAATGKTVTAERSIDGATYAACTNSGSVSEVGNGTYAIDLSAADTNGSNMVTLKFTATGCKATKIGIPLQTI